MLGFGSLALAWLAMAAPTAPSESASESGPTDRDAAPTSATPVVSPRMAAKSKPFNRHGVGARGGIVVIPSWILSRYFASHTNSLCRNNSVGEFAAARGLLRTDGCNFYAGGEYVYRQSRIFDIVGSIGYQRLKAPDGYFLSKKNWSSQCTSDASENADGIDPNLNRSCNLAAADYTEVNLQFLMIQADFVARAPIVITDDVEFGIGGGGGLGIGIVFDRVYQTPMGAPADGYVPGEGATNGDSCERLGDLADFRRCTPRWDPSEPGAPSELPGLEEPNPENYASCRKNGCSDADLQSFGYRRRQKDLPPVIPVINLIVSARLIVKDTLGITINGGWNTGFYFGGAMTYFLGKSLRRRSAQPR